MTWTEDAQLIDESIDAHPWAGIARRALAVVHPEMFAELEQSGELDAYCRVKAHEAIMSRETLIAHGSDPQIADSIAMELLSPIDSEPVAEGWEIEDAQNDEAAALFKYLGVEGGILADDEEDDDFEEED